MKTKLYAEHEGQTFTRTTEREYQFVVIGKYVKASDWIALNWCGRLNLAERKAGEHPQYEVIEIIPVKGAL